MTVPMQIGAVSQGEAIVVVGLLGLILWAVLRFQSLAGVVLWGVAVLIYVMSVGMDVPSEYFWLALAFATGITMLAGAVYMGGKL